MGAIRGTLCLIGATLCLGACAEQALPLLPQSMYQLNPTTVRKTQIALRHRGYYDGVADGYIGQHTANAIQRYQLDHCLRVKPITNRPLLRSLGIASNN